MTLFALSLMAPTDGSSSGMIVMAVQFAALIAIFYFLLIRPQSQARKKHQALLEGLKKGDEVITAAGIIGKVRDIKGQQVTIESGTAQLVIELGQVRQIGLAPPAAPAGQK